MANFPLCLDDPFVSGLRDIFKANILRIPEERIVPLTVLYTVKRSVYFLGHVGSLLEGAQFETPSADLKKSNMATLGNRRSGVIESKIGLQILSGLLAGMGSISVPDVSTYFKGVETLSFSFPKVRREYVEIARIGQLLTGRSIDRANLLHKTLLDPQTVVRIVDSVITAIDFEIELGGKDEVGLRLDLLPLQNVLAEAQIKVTSGDARRLYFHSHRRLTFAFTCVNVALLSNGKIRSIAPSMEGVGPPQLADERMRDRGLEAHVLLTRAPELINFDSAQEDQPCAST